MSAMSNDRSTSRVFFLYKNTYALLGLTLESWRPPSKNSNEMISINYNICTASLNTVQHTNISTTATATQNPYILLFVRNEVCGLCPPTPCQCFHNSGNLVILFVCKLSLAKFIMRLLQIV